MADTTQRWNTWASISTVIAVVIAAIAFAWGAKTELDAARAQAQATALGILQAQLALAVEHPDLATIDPADPTALDDPRYEWYAMYALMTADALFTLAGDDPAWRNTAGALVEPHLPLVLSPEFPCNFFGPAFLRFVREGTQEEATRQGVTFCPAR